MVPARCRADICPFMIIQRLRYKISLSLLLTLAVFAAGWLWKGSFGAVMAVLALLGLYLLYLCAFSLVKNIRRKRMGARDTVLKLTAYFMSFLLVAGTMEYMWVFHTIQADSLLETSEHPVNFTIWEYFFRSLVCSLDLFMLDVDSNILDRLDSHGNIKGILAAQSVISFLCTAFLLVGLIFTRVMAYFRLRHRTGIGKGRKHLYLFFGINEPSRLMIKQILEHDPDMAVPVIIDKANVADDNDDEWDGIVSLIAHKRRVFKLADSVGAYVTIAGQSISDIDSDGNRAIDLWGMLGLDTVKEFIEKLADDPEAQVNIFFLGGDEERNLRDVITLSRDRSLRLMALHHKEPTNKNPGFGASHMIYCHARRNSAYRVIEDIFLKQDINVRIVDSSRLAVDGLKLNELYHPASVMTFSATNPGTVDGGLNSLIIGFGEVGRDAFRFLYEYGAFVDSRSTEQQPVRCPFRCTIIDSDMTNISGNFQASMPAVFPKRADAGTNITFVDAPYNSELVRNDIFTPDFYRTLNYAVVALPDSDEAIALAIRIFEGVMRYRGNVDSLRIMVRCHDDDKVANLERIAWHYNHGYGRGKDNNPVICLFGEPRQIYTYDLVIADKLITNAKEFLDRYNQQSGDKRGWDERRKKATAGTPLQLTQLRGLRRRESQDISNAMHAFTKEMIFKRVMGKDFDIEDFFNLISTPGAPDRIQCEGEKESIHYPRLDRDKDAGMILLLLHLAQLEHLRWNASHEILGYLPTDVCNGSTSDETIMHHCCIRPWHELDDFSPKAGYDLKMCDFSVVNTTLAIWRRRVTEQKKNKENTPEMEEYKPQPIDTSSVELPAELKDLAEQLARNVHEVWAASRHSQGWTYGSKRDDANRETPCMVPYDQLPEEEKAYDRNTSLETIKLILKLGFKIIPPDKN